MLVRDIEYKSNIEYRFDITPWSTIDYRFTDHSIWKSADSGLISLVG